MGDHIDREHKDNDQRHRIFHEELPRDYENPLIQKLHIVIRLSIKVLSVLMTLVIIWGVFDVAYLLITKLLSPPYFLLSVSDIFQLFGAFMIVLIAVEIFINIRLYLGTNVLPIQLVIATALMAIARKVIVLDLNKVDASEVMSIAAVVLALGVTHWLVVNRS